MYGSEIKRGWPLLVEGTPCCLQRVIETTATRGLGYKTIEFKCKSAKDEVFPGYKEIYDDIVNGTISRRFCILSDCKKEEYTPRCALKRGHLSECRCSFVGRKDHPRKRELYEDRVIGKILEILNKKAVVSSPENPNPLWEINVTVFAAGGLHGEVVLIVRLIERLRQSRFNDNRSFKINIALIDLVYKECINRAWEFKPPCQPGSSFSWNGFIGGHLGLGQFMTEITQALPSWISVEGSVFGDKDEYLNAVRSNRGKYGHDLLIGCDIRDASMDTVPLFVQIQKEASLGGEPGILMIHQSDEALMCEVKTIASCQSIEDEVGPPPYDPFPLSACPITPSTFPHSSGVRTPVASSRAGPSRSVPQPQGSGCIIS